MPLTLRQVRYFVALAEEGSFGLAAARVHISQPALSLQIKEMESVLEARLVERLPREIRLTRAGAEVLTRARRILAEVGDLEQSVRWRDGLAGRLHLGVIPTVAPYLLPLALTRLRAQDLQLDIRVREAQTGDLVDRLLKGQIDAAVVALPSSLPGLATVPLFRDPFLLAASPARIESLMGDTEMLRPETLDPEALLLLDEGHCLADQALEVCGMPARRQVDLGASSLSTLCGLVAEGLGLTLLPEIAARTETAAHPGLALRRFADPEPARMLALAIRDGADRQGWVDDLAGLLRAAHQDLASADRGPDRLGELQKMGPADRLAGPE